MDMRFPRDRLNSDVLTLNFLNVIDGDNKALAIHWSLERADESDQPIYVITSEWRAIYILCWGGDFVFVSTGKEKL